MNRKQHWMERSKRKKKKRKGKKNLQTLAKIKCKKKQTQNTQIINHIAITKTWMKMEGKKTKCEKKGKVAFYVFKMCETHADVAR